MATRAWASTLDWPSHEDSFQVFGYPRGGRRGAADPGAADLPRHAWHQADHYLDLASDTIKPGMSGAAVLNLRSGAVCGVVVASKHPARPDGAWPSPGRPWRRIWVRCWPPTGPSTVRTGAGAGQRRPAPRPAGSRRRWHPGDRNGQMGTKPPLDGCSVRAESYRAQRKRLDYKVSGKCRPANRSESFKEISFTLPALGTSEIKLGHYKRGGRGGPETFQVYEAVFLVLETIEGIGSWKRAFQVSPTLLDRQSQRRKPVPMMVIPYDPPWPHN